MIKDHRCHVCRKTVYDKRKHPEQCHPFSGWQRVHGTRKTGDSRSAPKPDSAATRSLHAFFMQSQKDGSNRPAVEESALIASRPRADTEVGPSAHVRTMQNTGNTCYVNATLQSFIAVLGADDTSAELEPLLHHCSNHNQEQPPLNPTGLFSLRSLMPRWKFDGRQQDVAEFLTFLLQGNTGTLQPVDWQGRTDGILEAEDQDLTPLIMPLTRVCVTLQQACTDWYNNICQRALAWAPDILPVVIPRWTDGVKNIRPLDLRQCLNLRTWGAAQTRDWHTYEVRSGVYHIGNTLNAGTQATLGLSGSTQAGECSTSAMMLSGPNQPRPQIASK